MSGHLGERAAALVDGELGHADRERALAHLAHCDGCRAEVEAGRRLKAHLRSLRTSPPEAPAALLARLRAVADQPVGTPLPPPADGRRRPARGPSGARRPSGRAPRLRPRRVVTAGALLVVGLAGALALGGPTSGTPTPVDPTSPVFVSQYVDTTSEVPLMEPASASLVRVSSPGR